MISAQRGCRLCGLLLDKIQEQANGLTVMRDGNIQFWDDSEPDYGQFSFLLIEMNDERMRKW